jgi:hypothetical protein
MQTFNRICVEDYDIIDGEKSLTLKRAQEYITSAERDGCVTVFTNFWATGVPVRIFAGEQQFTPPNKVAAPRADGTTT